MEKKIAVGILGATGAIGQKLVALLANHPWFEVKELVASEASAGKVYATHVNWKEKTAIPTKTSMLKIKNCFTPLSAPILFSSLDAKIAGEAELHYAKLGHIVVSNSRNHRLDNNVPLIIPEINADHLQLIAKQQHNLLPKKNKRGGYIVTNPNCSVIMLALAMFPVFQRFGITNIMATTMQAISGAGYPGVPSLDILDNIIPHIAGEEEKIQTEILKIFGTYQHQQIKPASLKISVCCNRVSVYNGHTLAISFTTNKKATVQELIRNWQLMRGLDLPSSPQEVLQYFSSPSRPQPRLDIDAGNGMTVSIGNLRPSAVLDWKVTVLGHNTIRGAAGAAILNAELLIKKNML